MSELREIELAEEGEHIKLVNIFFNSFDTKDWSLMNQCLNDELELDYEAFRGIPKYVSSSADYIEKRKIGLKGLDTEHQVKHYSFLRQGEKVKLNCKFEIKRFEIGSNEYYHSYGTYEILIKKVEGESKIVGIKQKVTKSEGNRFIHGAFKHIR